MDQIKVELQDYMGGDRAIAEAAWTSSKDNQNRTNRPEEDVARVVNMLADYKHSVPFESVIFRFWIRMPIAVDRQFMTHRIGSHSGMSGRYRTMPNDFLEVPQDVFDILANVPSGNKRIAEYSSLCLASNMWYQETITKLRKDRDEGHVTADQFKRVREFFRGVLPQHNMTERVTLMNLRSWANFYKLRSKPDAQPEIQTVANLMHEEIVKHNVCPVALEALERNSWSI
jgi:flavin-dependent thymidylate synthase